VSRFDNTDKLFFKYLVKNRGHICEIHQRECPGIGTMHILPKGIYPRLRYSEEAVVLAGWFCSHYWTHHDARNEKAIYAEKRILEIRNYPNWEELKEHLLLVERIAPKNDLKMIAMYLKKELSTLEA